MIFLWLTFATETNKQSIVMNAKQAKHFLLSIDEDRFINWYNNSVVDPFGDFSYSTIRENDSEEIFQWAKDTFELEVFINFCKNAHYSEEDKYVIFTDDSIISFNSIEDFLDIEGYSEGLIDEFLANMEENISELLVW